MKKSNETRSDKREQFVATSGTSNKRTVILVTVLVITVAAVGYVLFGRISSSAASVARVAADVRIPVADVGGEAKFFEYKTASDKVIRFFVIRSSDGVYRAAADACEVCFRDKLGYQQKGDDMVCRKCGRHFPSRDVNVVTGGCNPSGIPITVQGDKLVIAAADLDAHAVLF